jgi:predicted nuclease with TOPRIM domain
MIGGKIPCTDCPYDKCNVEYNIACSPQLMKDAFDLINRQKAEYEDLQEQFRHLDIECERLEKANESQKAEIDRLQNKLDTVKQKVLETIPLVKDDIKTAKAEAIKEFAERLKEDVCSFGKHITVEDVDNLVKETVGDNNG